MPTSVHVLVDDAHDGHDAHDGNPNRVYTIDWREDLKGCLFDDKF